MEFAEISPVESLQLSSGSIDPAITYPNLIYVEYAFAFFICFMIIANIMVTLKCEIYDNCSSMFLMVILELLLFVKLMDLTYQIRDETDGLTLEARISRDIPSYLFSIICIVLLFQWSQTYIVLARPKNAGTILQKNYEYKIQVALIILYSIFLVADLVVSIMDYSQEYDEDRLVYLDKVFLVIFNIQNILTALLYILLYVLFRLLIRDRASQLPELNEMKHHVDGFFIFMIAI